VKGGLKAVAEAATPPPGVAWPAPQGGVGPSWPLSVLSSGSVSLLVK
jgi:hypothetical protein